MEKWWAPAVSGMKCFAFSILTLFLWISWSAGRSKPGASIRVHSKICIPPQIFPCSYDCRSLEAPRYTLRILCVHNAIFTMCNHGQAFFSAPLSSCADCRGSFFQFRGIAPNPKDASKLLVGPSFDGKFSPIFKAIWYHSPITTLSVEFWSHASGPLLCMFSPYII